MKQAATAKVLRHGRGQAVRLRKEFHFSAAEVRVRRLGRGVLLEPVECDAQDVRAVFTKMDQLTGGAFLRKGRPEQPPVPPLRVV